MLAKRFRNRLTRKPGASLCGSAGITLGLLSVCGGPRGVPLWCFDLYNTTTTSLNVERTIGGLKMQVEKESPARVWNQKFGNAPRKALYVGRPSRWGNPWIVNDSWCTRERAVWEYTEWLLEEEVPETRKLRWALWQGALKDRELVCWCVDQSGHGVCHAKVLAAISFQIHTLGWEQHVVYHWWQDKRAERKSW